MKKLLQCAAVSLALISLLSPGLRTSAQSTTNVIVLTDFDNTSPGWDYGYFYSWGWPPSGQDTNGTYTVDRTYSDPVTDPANGPVCMRYQFDDAAFYTLVTVNSGGFGTGFGGPLSWNGDPTQLSTNLEDYLFEFDVRVEGLLAGQTTANCSMQAQWMVTGTNIFQLNFNVTPGSNWTHYALLMSDKSGTEGTPGTLAYWVESVQNALITELRFNMNMDAPQPQFGWDDDNVVLVDNIKVSVISGAAVPEPPKFAATILYWNMDDHPVSDSYGGYNWSQNSSLPTFTYSTAAAGYGVGGSNAWILTMDNSALAAPNTPSWAGGGTGASGPTDFTMFGSGDLKQYLLSFDARVEGLNPDASQTTCRLQLFLDIPIPDLNTNNDMRLDFDIPAGSNWVTTTYTLNQGGIGLGSKAVFATNHAVNGLRIQNQIENAASEANWGFDTDNILIVDNLKLQRIYTNAAPIWIQSAGTNVVVTWATPLSGGTMDLQTATDVAGPWADVTPRPASPYTAPSGAGTLFVRTKWTAP